jgi:hypothetical protein
MRVQDTMCEVWYEAPKRPHTRPPFMPSYNPENTKRYPGIAGSYSASNFVG